MFICITLAGSQCLGGQQGTRSSMIGPNSVMICNGSGHLTDRSTPGGGGGGGGGYSLYDGWYIRAAVLTPFFDPQGTKLYLFGVFFSYPPTQKRSFGYKSSQNSIFLDPKYHFPSIFLGTIFSGPRHTPSNFSDRVPPPPTSWSVLTPSWPGNQDLNSI